MSLVRVLLPYSQPFMLGNCGGFATFVTCALEPAAQGAGSLVLLWD